MALQIIPLSGLTYHSHVYSEYKS